MFSESGMGSVPAPEFEPCIEIDCGTVERHDDPTMTGVFRYFVSSRIEPEVSVCIWDGARYDEAKSEALECSLVLRLPIRDLTPNAGGQG